MKKKRTKPAAKKPTKRKEAATVEGLPMIAAAMGRTVAEVKAARELALDGFRPGNRGHIPTLRKSFAKNEERIQKQVAYKSPTDEIKEQELRIAKSKADELEGKSINKEWACGRLRSMLEAQKRILYGKLGDEMPVQWVLDVPTNRALGLTVADMILGEIAAEVTIWEGK